MPWTAKVQKRTAFGGERTIELVYENSDFAPVTEVFSILTVTNDSLAKRAQITLDKLNNEDIALAAITEGPITPIAPDTKPPEDTAKSDFLLAYTKLQSLLKAAALGVLVDQGTIDALKKTLQDAVKPEFFDGAMLP